MQDIAGRYPLVPHAPWISSVHSAQRHVLLSAQVGSEHIDNERITPLRDLVHHDQCKASALPFVVCAWVIDVRQFHVSIWHPENVLGGIVGSSSAIGRRKEREQQEVEIGKDRKSVGKGKGVSGRRDLGGRRDIK